MPYVYMAAWFVFGFIAAAIVLYGPMMRKSIKLNMDAAKMFQKVSGKQDELLKVYQDYNELAQEHQKLLVEHLERQKEYGALQDEHIELYKAHAALQEAHIELQEAHVELQQKLAPEGKEGTA